MRAQVTRAATTITAASVTAAAFARREDEDRSVCPEDLPSLEPRG